MGIYWATNFFALSHDGLLSVSHDNVFIARLGDDEFGFVILGFAETSELLALAEHICVVVRETESVNSKIPPVRLTLGLSVFPITAHTADHMFDNANFALRYGKQNNRGNINNFVANHRAELCREAAIARAIQGANLVEELGKH